VRLLFDTNALLWLVRGNSRLGPIARASIENAQALVVSEISLAEISIKVSIGKLAAEPGLLTLIQNAGIERVNIHDTYLRRLESLPLIHRDPFDRLLIAHALSDGLTVVTSDPIFGRYGVSVIDASE
jgi:PIN domain nuclease of toxin-antitoxin system